MRTVLLVALAGLAVPGCGREPTRQQRAVQEQVLRDRLTDWARLMNNQAADSLAGWYRQDESLISLWPDGRRHRGWDEEAAALDGLFDAVSTLNLVVQDPTVEVLGHDVAVVTFRYSMDQMFRTEGRDIFSGRGTQVWVRDRDGPGWVIGTSHLSRNPGPAARALRP